MKSNLLAGLPQNETALFYSVFFFIEFSILFLDFSGKSDKKILQFSKLIPLQAIEKSIIFMPITWVGRFYWYSQHLDKL